MSVYRAVLSVYRAVFSVYRAVLSVYRAVLSVYRAGLSVYRARLTGTRSGWMRGGWMPCHMLLMFGGYPSSTLGSRLGVPRYRM